MLFTDKVYVIHRYSVCYSQIKYQIHTSISRHLETLREREVRLLEEVDGAVAEKEEVIQRRQARLNKALGVLHSSLANAVALGNHHQAAARHLHQALAQ